MLRGAVAAASIALLATALAGCSFAPDSAEVDAEAQAVFDRIVESVGATDPAILRTLEVLPAGSQACDGEGLVQTSRTARGTLAATADPEALGSVIRTAETTFERDGYVPADGAGDGATAWVSSDGVLISLTDASPVLVVAVFTPCLAP
jgi:hypothetical protein